MRVSMLLDRIEDIICIRSPHLLTEGKTAKFEVIFDEKLSEQRSLHEVNEQRREIFTHRARVVKKRPKLAVSERG
jgi:hypothetical protein